MRAPVVGGFHQSSTLMSSRGTGALSIIQLWADILALLLGRLARTAADQP